MKRKKKFRKKKQNKIIIILSILLLLGILLLGISKLDFRTDEVHFDVSLGEVSEVKWLGNGIFEEYYDKANKKLEELTLDEKIGQLLLVSYPSYNQVETLRKYNFGGYLFFEKDFQYKSLSQVKKMISELDGVSKIPILTAVDEEGGTVVRISTNRNLAPSMFQSPRTLYKQGGFDKIREDTINKSKVLSNLGINLNLAPVVDIASNTWDYMYYRSISGDKEVASNYAKTVVLASKGLGVSYTLKHFPGYGNNSDTHTGTSVDKRSYEDLMNKDIVPFKAGIEAGAEAVMVSHNIVRAIDKNNPASLSPDIHKLLRGELGFTGVIITDDIAMYAASSVKNSTVKAILAGNDLVITTNYMASINEIKKALNSGELMEEQIDSLVFRVIAWKYYKGLLKD